MNTTRVQRVQELRRSNAATAIPGKRPTGPQVEEWDVDDCYEGTGACGLRDCVVCGEAS